MAKDYGRLWKDVTNTTDEGKAVRTLAEILSDKEGRGFISRLRHQDVELCIEILDHGVTEHKLKAAEKQAFFVMLRRLAGTHGRLPDSIMITENIEVEGEIRASGGFADVRSGRYMGSLVAVKTLRVAAQDDLQKIRKQFCKEVILWSTLSHPNVLKLAGVQGDMEKGQLVTVSEWMAHGNIMEYIKKNHVNRLDLLHGAAQGLKYLHNAGLIHGDLKGANVLISNHTLPRACLADFGFMTMVLDPSQPMSCSTQLERSTVTFMPPELLAPSEFGIKDPVPTPQADVYAFGLVIYQVLIGEIPFRSAWQKDLGFSVVQGMRPAKPENASAVGFSGSLWDFVQRCWDGNMRLRPKVAEVVEHLERAAADWGGLMPPCVHAKDVTSASEEPISDSMNRFEILQLPSGVVPQSPTETQTVFEPSSRSNISFAQYSESVGDESVTSVSQEGDCSMERRGASQSSSELLASDPSTHRNRGIHFSASARPLWPQVFTSKNRVIARCLCGLRVVFRILDKSSLRYSDLVSIFCEKQFRERVSSLQHEDVAQLVDYLDSIIHTLEPASSASQMYLRRLAWACSTQKILPKSCTISDTLLNTGGRPCASGILADMYEGSLDGFKVCVEKVRMYSDGGDPENVTRMFFKEAVMRKHFMHRNVVPFLGAILNPPQIVSVWMPGGCLAEYVTTHPEKSRLDLLYDVAQGLDYLHSHDVVHGDLKGQNILVDATGHARITGLGLITATLDLESTTPFAEGPVARFTAPEILGGDTTASKEADVFSFAMIMIEVFTGAAPFVHSPPVTVAVRILAGKRPERPAHSSLTDELWDLNRRCWDQQPLSRPRISEVVGYLRTVLAIQEGHADESGISVKYDTISSSSRQKEQLHRLPREPTYSTATRWLLALWKPRKSSDEYQDALDQLPGIESDTPGDSLHNMKSGEREKLLGKRNVPSGSRGLLRRATFWLSDHGACATQNWHGRPDASAEKHGAAQKLNNTPPTSNRTEPRSCMSLKPFIFQLSRFSPCRSNKYMEQ